MQSDRRKNPPSAARKRLRQARAPQVGQDPGREESRVTTLRIARRALAAARNKLLARTTSRSRRLFLLRCSLDDIDSFASPKNCRTPLAPSLAGRAMAFPAIILGPVRGVALRLGKSDLAQPRLSQHAHARALCGLRPRHEYGRSHENVDIWCSDSPARRRIRIYGKRPIFRCAASGEQLRWWQSQELGRCRGYLLMGNPRWDERIRYSPTSARRFRSRKTCTSRDAEVGERIPRVLEAS